MHSAIHHLVYFVAFHQLNSQCLFPGYLGDVALLCGVVRWNAYCSFSPSFLLSFRAQYTRTKGEYAICWRFTEWVGQFPDLRFFILFASFAPFCDIVSIDSPISKSLMLTIISSNASLGSTKVFKCPHRNNDSIFTHNDLII
ncbi:hypothetical protein H5410_061677 [Solanum commersonii]|uniref:Uncharacterized protein n=1 Tax=Solanum commersonii TaxID=4109 RepID=A0A9J5W9B4_SOLCO|nr:hypothetical protein H5410_061677 [Solanum commersonii]